MSGEAGRRVRGRLHVTYAHEGASSVASLLAFQSGTTSELWDGGMTVGIKRPYAPRTKLSGQIHLPSGAVIGFEGVVLACFAGEMVVEFSKAPEATYHAFLMTVGDAPTPREQPARPADLDSMGLRIDVQEPGKGPDTLIPIDVKSGNTDETMPLQEMLEDYLKKS